MEYSLQQSTTISFADVAHQTLIFDAAEPTARLVLQLLDTPWMQRLRQISQTGNTRLVYMYAEHSRFGHSLGVAYLATTLMKNLARYAPKQVAEYQDAVAAAALLHDIGHVAPGSHLAERLWGVQGGQHEEVSARVIQEDDAIRSILDARSPGLVERVCAILLETDAVPSWTKQIISGGGWNADRGNWAIVDSAMCSVSYGRYNVMSLLDSFRLTAAGQLVLQENRLDALTHFLVARDSMYRQVYQHRVLQTVDTMVENIVLRLRDIIGDLPSKADTAREHIATTLNEHHIFADATLVEALLAKTASATQSLATIFEMNESWWSYHLSRWCNSGDSVLSNLARRLRDRDPLKTVRLDFGGLDVTAVDFTALDSTGPDYTAAMERIESDPLVLRAKQLARELGYDPRYYVSIVRHADMHRGKQEEIPLVLRDNGSIVPLTEVEPMVANLLQRNSGARIWLSVPKEVKEGLGRTR